MSSKAVKNYQKIYTALLSFLNVYNVCHWLSCFTSFFFNRTTLLDVNI